MHFNRNSTPDNRDYEFQPQNMDHSAGQQEKSEIMSKMTGPKGKPTQAVKQLREERFVEDPITGSEVSIKDANFEDFPMEEKRQDSSINLTLESDLNHHDGEDFEANSPTKAGNMLLQAYPPPAPVSFQRFQRLLEQLQLGLAAAFGLFWLIFSFPHGKWWLPLTWAWLVLILRSTLVGLIGFTAITCVSMVQRNLEKEIEQVRAHMHRTRGERFLSVIPESVEWLNACTRTFWGLINPDFFVPIADQLEDVMQQSLPAIVDAVRVSDIGQGVNPIRAIYVRALSDQPIHNEYPREEWIDQGTNILHEEQKQAQKEGKDVDQSGDYVNFELAFSYQALKTQGYDLRSKNIHLLLELFLGVYDWMHIPIPIWVQLEGFVGTVRLRVQFIPESPFIRNVTITFMGVPAIDVSVYPLSKALPNLLDLPLISRFMKSVLAATTAEYVAPKSLTINVQDMLSTTAIGDTKAMGVFLITIHHGKDLTARDQYGKSDPYIVLAFAKFGKPLYSTRIILGDLNPCFEETAYLLLTEDELKSDEELSIMLWDSDRRSPDDLMGRINISVKELIKKSNEVVQRTDSLKGFEDADMMAGSLSWSIGYFTKVPLREEFERKPEDTSTPSTLAANDFPPPPPDIRRIPPDLEYRSGILSFVIHQINNLERQNLEGTTGKDREGRAGQDTDQPSEQSSNLPSAYCEVIINDSLVYKTRVKQYTTMPFFEAGTERFIRDWRSTVVRIVVRDARLREKDPILGIVNLHLGKVFQDGSEITRTYSITEGIGFGRINISLLFRNVKLQLPRNSLGWDIGTVQILSPISLQLQPNALQNDSLASRRLSISTVDSHEHVPRSSKREGREDGRISWDIDALHLRIYNRYSSSLILEVGGDKSILPTGHSQPEILGLLWLPDIIDDEDIDVSIPAIMGEDLEQLRQNCLTDFTASTHSYKVVGEFKLRVRMDSGLDEDHEQHADTQARRHAYEAYDHIEGEAKLAERSAHAGDDDVIDKSERKAIKQAHKRQLANRHRGINSLRPYRTAKWMKEGLVNRVKPKKGSFKRQVAVQSEA